MKYSKNSLDLALEVLLPNVPTISRLGSPHIDRPAKIKMVAWNHFVRQVRDGVTASRDYDVNLCLYVVQQAAFELEKIGFMTFGNRELKDEIDTMNLLKEEIHAT